MESSQCPPRRAKNTTCIPPAYARYLKSKAAVAPAAADDDEDDDEAQSSVANSNDDSPLFGRKDGQKIAVSSSSPNSSSSIQLSPQDDETATNSPFPEQDPEQEAVSERPRNEGSEPDDAAVDGAAPASTAPAPAPPLHPYAMYRMRSTSAPRSSSPQQQRRRGGESAEAVTGAAAAGAASSTVLPPRHPYAIYRSRYMSSIKEVHDLVRPILDRDEGSEVVRSNNPSNGDEQSSSAPTTRHRDDDEESSSNYTTRRDLQHPPLFMELNCRNPLEQQEDVEPASPLQHDDTESSSWPTTTGQQRIPEAEGRPLPSEPPFLADDEEEEEDPGGSVTNGENPVIVIEEQTKFPYLPCSSGAKRSTCLLAALLLSLVVGGIVAAAAIVLTRSDPSPKAPGTYSCLETNADLKKAADLHLAWLAVNTDDDKSAGADTSSGITEDSAATAAAVRSLTDKYGPLENWCLGPGVNSLEKLFSARRNPLAARFFKGNLSKWNVTSKIVDMTDLFWGAQQFTAVDGLDQWDTSGVTSMWGTFANAHQFNSPSILQWNTSQVRNMQEIFFNASSFNQDLSGWDVRRVRNWVSAFQSARVFQQDLCLWNTQATQQLAQSGRILTGGMFLDTQCWAENDPFVVGSSITSGGNGSARAAIASKSFCAPCQPSEWPKCFESTAELQNAVDAYMEAKEEASTATQFSNVAQTYGYPMRHWCVSQLTSLDDVFSILRNPALLVFNEDLSGWDTSNVRTMRRIFRGANESEKIPGTADQIPLSSFNRDISMWNVSQVVDMSYAFSHAGGFNAPLAAWDVSRVEIMDGMFNDAARFNQPLGSWDVSNVVSMRRMFRAADAFNQPIEEWQLKSLFDAGYMFSSAYGFNQPLLAWNVSSVRYMESMFHFATSFNQALSDWDVANVETTANMFYHADNFSQALDSWRLESVTDVSGMFSRAVAFNAPLFPLPAQITNLTQFLSMTESFNHASIAEWDVSRVRVMTRLFDSATAFNVNINGWNTASLEKVDFLFSRASVFNQPLENWKLSPRVTSLRLMFTEAVSFNQPLNGWNVSSVTNLNECFSFATAFNQDLGSWQVQNVQQAKKCFQYAESFNQNLCSWSMPRATKTRNMFDGTACPDQTDPAAAPPTAPTSFCHAC